MLYEKLKKNYQPKNIMEKLYNIDSEIRKDLEGNDELLYKYNKIQDELLSTACEAERIAYITGIKEAIRFMIECIK